MKYLIGSDPTGRIFRLFAVYDEDTGLTLKGTFLINPEGKLLSSEVNFYNVGRSSDELLRKLKANTYQVIQRRHFLKNGLKEQKPQNLLKDSRRSREALK